VKRSRRIAIQSLMIAGLTWSGPAILARTPTAAPQTPSTQSQPNSENPNQAPHGAQMPVTPHQTAPTQPQSPLDPADSQQATPLPPDQNAPMRQDAQNPNQLGPEQQPPTKATPSKETPVPADDRADPDRVKPSQQPPPQVTPPQDQTPPPHGDI
jgi:hypothetical protein